MSSAPDISEVLRSHVAPLAQALAGASPCGEDPRHDPRFVELREEATRNDSLSEQRTDWNRVQRDAEQILTGVAKDLRVAAYLGVAYVQNEGLEGMGKGLTLLSTILETHGETVYPLPRRGRSTGRANAVEWFIERAATWAADQPKPMAEQALVEFLGTQLRSLSGECESRFEDASPSFSELRKQIRRVAVKAAPAPAPEPEPEPQPKPQPDPAQATAAAPTSPAPTPVSAPASSGAVQAAPQDASDRSPYLLNVGTELRKLAHALREANPREPAAYRLLRQSLWLHLDHEPPQTHPGRCELPSPTALERKTLAGHTEQARWPGLLQTAENLLTNYRFCLDLHFATITALRGLGDSAQAQTAVIAELRALLTRMPNLVQMRGQGDQPLAGPETAAWIASEVQGGSGSSESMDSTADESWWEAIAAIPAQDQAGRLTGLQAALDTAPDRVTYAQRALLAAQSLPEIRGLPLLLSCLAQRALERTGGQALHRGLEARYLKQILQARVGPGAAKIPALAKPELAEMALDLGQRDLSAALRYYGG